jgi:hypothetical protein
VQAELADFQGDTSFRRFTLGDEIITVFVDNSSMSNRYPLKAGLAFRILPGNIQHVRLGGTGDYSQTLQHIRAGLGDAAINPGFVIKQHVLLWAEGINLFESDVSLGRAATGSLQILEKDCQDLDTFERLAGIITQFQTNRGFHFDEFIG